MSMKSGHELQPLASAQEYKSGHEWILDPLAYRILEGAPGQVRTTVGICWDIVNCIKFCLKSGDQHSVLACGDNLTDQFL